MSIRTITSTAALKPWLPSDYTATGWDDNQIQQALDDGHDPRLIAAEIWEEYAGTLPEADANAVTRWTNLDTSVEYGAAVSPRDYALRQARYHRSRSRVRSVPLAHKRIEGDVAEGLIAEPPDEGE